MCVIVCVYVCVRVYECVTKIKHWPWGCVIVYVIVCVFQLACGMNTDIDGEL